MTLALTRDDDRDAVIAELRDKLLFVAVIVLAVFALAYRQVAADTQRRLADAEQRLADAERRLADSERER